MDFTKSEIRSAPRKPFFIVDITSKEIANQRIPMSLSSVVSSRQRSIMVSSSFTSTPPAAKGSAMFQAFSTP